MEEKSEALEFTLVFFLVQYRMNEYYSPVLFKNYYRNRLFKSAYNVKGYYNWFVVYDSMMIFYKVMNIALSLLMKS